MKKISLTRGQFTLVDDEDFEFLNSFKWYFKVHHHSQGYAARTIASRGERRLVSMHRLLMKARDGDIVDHVNGDKLDNRKLNLRICNISQNNANCHTKNKGGYKGVGCIGKKFRASISINGKFLHLGMFDTKELAAKAYNVAAIKQFGEFAKLNQL